MSESSINHSTATPEATAFQYEQAEHSPGFVLWQLTMLWQQKIAEVLAVFALTQTQFALLASLQWLLEHGQLPTQATLGAHSKIDKMTLSKAIRNLEQHGWVDRVPSASDSRALCISLTATGQDSIKAAIAAVESADEVFFAALDTPARQQYLHIAQTLIQHNRAP